MSVEMLTLVWERFPGEEIRELHVLLILADQANGYGRADLTVAAIARKARLSVCELNQVIETLEFQEWLRIIPQPGSDASMYYLNTHKLGRCAPLPEVE